LLGLAVILVPFVIVSGTIDHVHKLLSRAASEVSVPLDGVAGAGVAIAIFLLILFACWFLGRLMTNTVLGQQILEWEKSKFLKPKLLKKSPLLAKQAARSEEAAKASSPAVPALAHVAGVWQPGVIVEEPTSGWATVFLPEVPGLATGRLYCLQDAQVLRLETPLDDFREMLSSSGKGSGDWLTALAAVQAAQT